MDGSSRKPRTVAPPWCAGAPTSPVAAPALAALCAHGLPLARPVKAEAPALYIAIAALGAAAPSRIEAIDAPCVTSEPHATWARDAACTRPGRASRVGASVADEPVVVHVAHAIAESDIDGAGQALDALLDNIEAYTRSMVV